MSRKLNRYSLFAPGFFLANQQGSTRHIGQHITHRKTPFRRKPVEDLNSRLVGKAIRATVPYRLVLAYPRPPQRFDAEVTEIISTENMSVFIHLEPIGRIIVKVKRRSEMIFVPGFIKG